MMDPKATDGLFTVFGQVTSKGAFSMVGHAKAKTRICSLIEALSLEESILADARPKAGSLKSNEVL